MGSDAPRRKAALDVGDVYTGVAVSDPGATLARPLEVVRSEHLLQYLRDLFAQNEVREVLVGVPKTLGGGVGFQARRTLEKVETLEAEFPEVRFVPWDERLTTRLARGVRAGGAGRKRKKGGGKERLDHVAAASMLQEYLDRRGPVGTTP